MERVYFARGCRGAIPKRMQTCLAISGDYAGTIDGVYGGATARAIGQVQAAHRLPVTGGVDETTWMTVTQSPLPSLGERCLQLTAAFEGHGFPIVQGNYDGAWMTWGIIGFTLKHGQIQRLILQAWSIDPGTVHAAFGNRTTELVQLMSRNRPAQLKSWANSVSIGPTRSRVAEPWRSGFMALGESPLVRQLQIQRAIEGYFTPCLATAAKYNLTSELGVALCFDIHVQNGSIKPAAHANIVRRIGSDFIAQSEAQRRVVIAEAVADAASRTFGEDVRSRKRAIATGAGTVHGEFFQLQSWGLGEFEA